MTNTQRIAAYIDSSPNKEKLKAALPLLLDLFFQKNEECPREDPEGGKQG